MVYVRSGSATGWLRESENKKPTKMVAKAEGKTAVKAKKRVAARIIESSNESEGEGEWAETVRNSWQKRDKEERRRTTRESDDER